MSPTSTLPARNRPRASKGVPAATFASLTAVDTDDCLLWPHAKDSSGYGRLNLRGTTEPAHALACEMRHGPRPSSNHDAAHSCGVPACVNPRHLRWATKVENSLDRHAHGTMRVGVAAAGNRLSADDVREIRRRITAGEHQAELAEHFQVHQTTIHCIIAGKSWAWLDR